MFNIRYLMFDTRCSRFSRRLSVLVPIRWPSWTRARGRAAWAPLSPPSLQKSCTTSSTHRCVSIERTTVVVVIVVGTVSTFLIYRSIEHSIYHSVSRNKLVLRSIGYCVNFFDMLKYRACDITSKSKLVLDIVYFFTNPPEDIKKKVSKVSMCCALDVSYRTRFASSPRPRSRRAVPRAQHTGALRRTSRSPTQAFRQTPVD